jgi:pseudouridine synthase
MKTVPVRLQKFLADAGVASRRAAEKIIAEGRVEVNGRKVTATGSKVDPAADKVKLDGRAVEVRKRLYVALNKPPGYVCSRNDPDDRRLASQLLPREWDHLYSVGRLDYESEGLILFTNDGDFCLRVSHPRYGMTKVYMVTVKGTMDNNVIRRITAGVQHDGELLKALKARVLASGQSTSMVEVVLGEGKNREVRRLFESQGLEVLRLMRTQVGKIRLGQLPSGKWRTLTDTEVETLLSKL